MTACVAPAGRYQWGDYRESDGGRHRLPPGEEGPEALEEADEVFHHQRSCQGGFGPVDHRLVRPESAGGNGRPYRPALSKARAARHRETARLAVSRFVGAPQGGHHRVEGAEEDKGRSGLGHPMAQAILCFMVAHGRDIGRHGPEEGIEQRPQPDGGGSVRFQRCRHPGQARTSRPTPAMQRDHEMFVGPFQVFPPLFGQLLRFGRVARHGRVGYRGFLEACGDGVFFGAESHARASLLRPAPEGAKKRPSATGRRVNVSIRCSLLVHRSYRRAPTGGI